MTNLKLPLIAAALLVGGLCHAAQELVIPPPHIGKLIQETAERHGLNRFVFEGLIWRESNFNPKVPGDDGRSLGLGQIQLTTARAKPLYYKGTRAKLFEPKTNLEYAARYLVHQLKRYDWDYRKALSAYNAGSHIRSNARYVKAILGYAKWRQENFPPDDPGSLVQSISQEILPGRDILYFL